MFKEPDQHRRRARAATIQEIANEAILAGKTNDETLTAVLSAFPDSGANPRTISWYRSQLRNQGHDVPKDRELKNRRATGQVAATTAREDMDDLALVQTVLEVLRMNGEPAQELRRAIVAALRSQKKESAHDIFASDLPDESFDGVFPEKRETGWREVDL